MNYRTTLAALVFAALLMVSPAAAAAPGLNFANDDAPNPYGHSDVETIAAHDLGEMDAPLQLFDDEGNVHELGATYNESQDTPFGVRWDKVDSEAYRLFPRVDGETENGATWTEASQWSTTGGAIADADADGVEKVEFDATTAGDSATFGGENVSLDDPNKRVLMAVLNVDALASGTTVELRVVDGDGDYRYATIDTADNASSDTSIANSTGNGYVFQERVGDLTLGGSGDGTLDSIESVEIHSVGGTSTVTLAGLDVDRKSAIEFGTIQRDTDTSDDDLETVTFEDYYEGGVANLTAYEFGSQFSTAVIHDWQVYDVRYPFSELTDDSEHSVNFSESPSSYPMQLELYGDIQVPNYIDLSHGSLSLKVEQGFIGDRYGTLEVSSDVPDDEPIGNLSASDYTDKLGTVGQEGDTLTLLNSISGDTQYRVHLVLNLQDGEVDALMGSSAMGPTGGSGGFFSGIINFFTTLPGAILGTVGGFLGIRRLGFLGGGS